MSTRCDVVTVGYETLRGEKQAKERRHMKLETVYENLCCADPRNPHFADLMAYEIEMDEPIPEARTDGCACDSCFHGKDELALEIINLQNKLQALYLNVASKGMM